MLDGQEQCSAASCNEELLASGASLYQLEQKGYQEDDMLHRFTQDLQDAGCLQEPYLSDMSVSPYGTLLFCAGYGSGLAVVDLDASKPRQESRSRLFGGWKKPLVGQ